MVEKQPGLVGWQGLTRGSPEVPEALSPVMRLGRGRRGRQRLLPQRLSTALPLPSCPWWWKEVTRLCPTVTLLLMLVAGAHPNAKTALKAVASSHHVLSTCFQRVDAFLNDQTDLPKGLSLAALPSCQLLAVLPERQRCCDLPIVLMTSSESSWI